MKKTTWKVITGNFARTIATGFPSYEAAYNWCLMNDWGQYEQDDGLMIVRAS